MIRVEIIYFICFFFLFQLIDIFRRYIAHTVVIKDPLEWWRTVGTYAYQRLAAKARQYLAVPATKVPAERLLSMAGNTITKKCASLGLLTFHNIYHI